MNCFEKEVKELTTELTKALSQAERQSAIKQLEKILEEVDVNMPETSLNNILELIEKRLATLKGVEVNG